jgi:hypothetical protein
LQTGAYLARSWLLCSAETPNMQALHDAPTAAAQCPFHQAAHEATEGLRAGDWLSLPMHRRMVVQHDQRDDGAPELRLFYGDKEISFDEPELFAFGEQLARQDRFRAGDTVQWGEGLQWPRMQGLLQILLDEGVLQRADGAEGAAEGPRELDRPAPLPAGTNRTPRHWNDCSEVLQQLTGRALEPGWLELVVPVFRVAHMVLDADGRQVGEANVFPPALRMDIATRWRTCIYPGTRHQVDRPMNVTALKAMRAQWPQMMRALRHVRAAYLQRFPQARQGWTVGHVERLSTSVLAVPTYALMHPQRPLASGQLHPALSSLFRVTDGLRMVMHQMLFVPIGEPTVPATTQVGSEQILAYAERNYSFHSEHGVCAGPQAMVAEFLAVLLDGHVPAGNDAVVLEPEVARALHDLDPAVDYAMTALQAHAAAFSLWPRMARTYEQLLPLVQAWAEIGTPGVRELHRRVQTHVSRVQQDTYLAQEAWRVSREQVYGDMYDQCGLALQDGRTAAQAPLAEQLLAPPHAGADTFQHDLADVLRRQLGRADGHDEHHLQAVAHRLADYGHQVQQLLRVACEAQTRVQRLMGRATPQRPFSSADLDLYNQLQGQATRRMPDLLAELGPLLGQPITVDVHGLHIGETPAMAAA